MTCAASGLGQRSPAVLGSPAAAARFSCPAAGASPAGTVGSMIRLCDTDSGGCAVEVLQSCQHEPLLVTALQMQGREHSCTVAPTTQQRHAMMSDCCLRRAQQAHMLPQQVQRRSDASWTVVPKLGTRCPHHTPKISELLSITYLSFLSSPIGFPAAAG